MIPAGVSSVLATSILCPSSFVYPASVYGCAARQHNAPHTRAANLARAYRVLGGAERRRDGDLAEVRASAARLAHEVQDDLGRVDRRAAAHAHDRVCARGVKRSDAAPDVRDGRVLADLVEGRAVLAARLEDILDDRDDVGLLEVEGRGR